MRRAFIVRPFETKEVSPGRQVDFERIDRELISAALDELGIHGRTTAEILKQGEIQGDMFERLVTAELVIADISMANANVFYELGIRHALQDRHTVLIKFAFEGQRPIFDITTDRYLLFDADDPGKAKDALVERIRATLEENEADSPVFRFLPALVPQDRDLFVNVPLEFREDLELAVKKRRDGELDLYATELRELDISWSSAGLRRVAEAQFKRKAWEAARETWESIRESNVLDPLANRRLATIYAKQSKPDLDKSDQAVARALPGAHPEVLAELHALRGSNAKSRWMADWALEPEPEARRKAALECPHLTLAFEEYRTGFWGYLNSYYAGINALALLKIRLELAQAFPDVWSASFESDEAASAALKAALGLYEQLSAAVRVSIDAAKAKGDSWAAIALADYECLVSDRPGYVRTLYEAEFAKSDSQARESVVRQLEILTRLGIASENAAAALQIAKKSSVLPPAFVPALALVFSGHRLDAAGRKTPRFPARAEALARRLIREKVSALVQEAAGPAVGYAGCASGGDILFHEVCEELGVPTTVLLAGPRADYVRESVQDGGPDWVRRFDAIVKKHGDAVRQLTDDLTLPRWLRGVRNFDIWAHNNLWTLHTAFVHGADKVVLIALWNGAEGDGPGGTEHMVSEVQKRGGRAEILDAKRLLTET